MDGQQTNRQSMLSYRTGGSSNRNDESGLPSQRASQRFSIVQDNESRIKGDAFHPENSEQESHTDMSQSDFRVSYKYVPKEGHRVSHIAPQELQDILSEKEDEESDDDKRGSRSRQEMIPKKNHLTLDDQTRN